VCAIVQKIVAIGQTVAEIWRFLIFMAAVYVIWQANIFSSCDFYFFLLSTYFSYFLLA